MIHRLKAVFNVLLGVSVLFLVLHIFYRDKLEEVLADLWDANYTKDSQFQTSAGGLYCDGDWTKKYKDYHAKTLKSTSEDRKFLIYYCRGHNAGCGGYGNRMLGIISTFYLAVLLNRTFLLHWGGPEKLDTYFQPNMIDWTYDESKLTGLKSRNNRWGIQEVKGYERQVTVGQKRFHAWFQHTDVEPYFNLPVEKMATMWYFAPRIWDNDYLKKRASQLGIPKPRDEYPWGMCGCAMKFLFKKSRYFVKEFRKAKVALSERARPFIGIHVRTSDHHFGSFNEFSYRTRDHRAVFACAQRVERAFKQKNRILAKKPFTWFLAADDKKVKMEAMRRHPRSVVTLDIIPSHIEHTKTKYGDALRDLLLDQLLLQECDYFIPTWDSTFSYMVIGTRQFPQKSFVFGEKCNLDEKGVVLTSPPGKKKPAS